MPTVSWQSTSAIDRYGTSRAPPGTTVLGIDGLSWHDGRLIAIQNGVTPPRIIGIRLSAAGEGIAGVEVLDRHLPLADEPTIGTITDDRFVYVANSQWEKYDETGTLRANAVLTAPVLLSLPLPRPH